MAKAKKNIQKTKVIKEKEKTKVLIPAKEEEAGMEEEQLVVLTVKEIRAIQKDVKFNLKDLSLLPPAPYERITLGLSISKMNASDICVYSVDKFLRIEAIPLFADNCYPTTDDCRLVYDQLLLLAGQRTIFMNLSDRSNKKKWTKLLKDMVSDMLASCANISNGNKSLFLLTGGKLKGKWTRRDAQLRECSFKLGTKEGKGKLRVIAEPVKYAVNYTIYFTNRPTLDIETSKHKTGGSDQVLEDLIPGELMLITIVANGKKIRGDVANPQTRRVPFN